MPLSVPIPRILWKSRGDTQRKAHHANKHNVRKVSAQHVMCQGVRKQPIRNSRPDGALDRRCHLRQAIRCAERPFIRNGRRNVHVYRSCHRYQYLCKNVCKEHLRYPESKKHNDNSCTIMSTYTTTFGPLPANVAKFSKGKMTKITADEKMLQTKTFRSPKRLKKRGKKKNWNNPSMPPYKDIHIPIDSGCILSPPNSTGVDHISGVHASSTALRSASIA